MHVYLDINSFSNSPKSREKLFRDHSNSVKFQMLTTAFNAKETVFANKLQYTFGISREPLEKFK